MSTDVRGRGRGKKISIASPVTLGAGGVRVDWEKCCICQEISSQNTECPAANPILSRRNVGYISFARKLEELKPLKFIFPSNLSVEYLDDGSGFQSTLEKNKAKWHKTCHLPFRNPEKFKQLKSKLLNDKSSVLSEAPTETSSEQFADTSTRLTRSTVSRVDLKGSVCFLCNKADEVHNLHKCSTKEIQANIQECARKVGRTDVVALLSSGDVIALEAKYHLRCLTKLYNQTRRLQGEREGASGDVMCEGIAFADLAAFIHAKMQSNCAFKLADLKRQYLDRLGQLLGVPNDQLPYVHSTRFSEKVLSQFPSLRAGKEGRDIVLRSRSSNILYNIEEEDQDQDALAFFRFCKGLRREILQKTQSFTGHLLENSQTDCIPPILHAAMNVILYGQPITSQCGASKPALTLCQLVMLNVQKTIPKGDIVRHKPTQETVFPLYLGLSLYARTRKRNVIDKMHQFGVSVSSAHIRQVSSNLCYEVIERASEEKILCPANLKMGSFTVGAYDNIDHNPRSVSASGSFHGTSISVFQMGGVNEMKRQYETNYQNVAIKGRKGIPLLPDSYALVPDCVLKSKKPPVTRCREDIAHTLTVPVWTAKRLMAESDWLDHVHEQMESNTGGFLPNLSWSAFHACNLLHDSNPFAVTEEALLPLFYESSSSIPMLRHGLDIIRNLTEYLNPAQTPVLCVDQLLYVTAKQIQWDQPHKYGESKFFVLLGGFHIEQAFLRAVGSFAEGSGWKSVMAASGIMSDTSAESILKVTHVTKARATYQVTAAALYALLQEAYDDYRSSMGPLNFEQWIDECATSFPTFHYWLLFLELILAVLSFVRSIREGNFSDYIQSIRLILPWFFYLNHVHYARWLSVHLKDLLALPDTAPDLHREFHSGKFVVRKTKRVFSALAVDQAHEQNNAKVKADGGAIGLTESPAALRRWMLSGPEIARLLEEFEGVDIDEMDLDYHHEQYPAYQTQFLSRCSAVKVSFLEFGNPFLEQHKELVTLDTRVYVEQDGLDALQNAEKVSTEIYTDFVKERLWSGKKSLYEPISRVNSDIFTAKRKKPSTATKIKELREDLQLFSRLFIITKTRDLDMPTFFMHENHAYPIAISAGGNLRPGEKSLLLQPLLKLVSNGDCPTACCGLVLDGAAVVHFLPPKISSTFDEYYTLEFLPYLREKSRSLHARRLDVVWDFYGDTSVKTWTRQERGAGVRRNVRPEDRIPRDWPDFLRNADNKKQLFSFLGTKLLSETLPIEIVTNISEVIQKNETAVSSLHGIRCPHIMEEADARIILHTRDMVQNGAKNIWVRTVDTDVVVLAISFFFYLKSLGLEKLWVFQGMGAKREYFPVHLITEKLGKERTESLLGFHAFTGSDSTSFFSSKGKKSAWNAWEDFPEVTKAFLDISKPVTTISPETWQLLQRFTVRMYDKNCEALSVNDARYYLFATGNRSITLIPPTAAALYQHTLRVAYQAGHIWGTAHEVLEPSKIPNPTDWGWQRDGSQLRPLWTTLPQMSKACKELAKCGCRKGCTPQRCSCKRAGLLCTLQCTPCKGKCGDNNEQPMEAIIEEDEDGVFL